MAVRGWGVSIVTAVGVAAGAGAAQLGIGYGLGIIAWLPAAAADGDAAWVASLAWATWIAASSVFAGAVCADRLASSPGPESIRESTVEFTGKSAVEATGESTVESAGDRSTGRTSPGPVATALWRLALAVAAALGGLVTVVLVAVPARVAQRSDSFAPELIAGGYAAVGVLTGLVVAFGALTSRAVAANVIATVSWLWLLAVVSVIHGVVIGRGLATAQLGVWEFTDDGPWLRNLYVPGMLLSLIAALLLGGFAAWPAARRNDNRVGVAVSGAVGPLLVAAAYFLAAPRLAGVRPEQFSAYLLAPYAVIAGLAGSVLVSALGPPTGSLPTQPAPAQPARAPATQHPPAQDLPAQDLPSQPATARPDEVPPEASTPPALPDPASSPAAATPRPATGPAPVPLPDATVHSAADTAPDTAPEQAGRTAQRDVPAERARTGVARGRATPPPAGQGKRPR